MRKIGNPNRISTANELMRIGRRQRRDQLINREGRDAILKRLKNLLRDARPIDGVYDLLSNVAAQRCVEEDFWSPGHVLLRQFTVRDTTSLLRSLRSAGGYCAKLTFEMPSLAASLANLDIARAHHRPWRPGRSQQESWQIRHLAFQWFIYPLRKWSARKVALWLGVHHHYVQKLVQEFKSNPEKIWNEVRESGYEAATFKGLQEAREITRQMGTRNLLRPREWRVRIRDPLERARRLEIEGVRKWYDPDREKVWPKRAVWKTVTAYANIRGRIPREIPPWATPEFSMFLANSGMRRTA